MNLQAVIDLAGQQPQWLLAWFLGLPLLAWLTGLLHRPGQSARAPWKYLYAALVYLLSIPGVFALMLLAYTLFFIRGNLLEVNLLVYFLPVASWIAGLILIRRKARFQDIPGFERLSGLFILLGVTFFVLLMIDKTRIFVGFFGSFTGLLIFGVLVFLVLRWATRKLLG